VDEETGVVAGGFANIKTEVKNSNTHEESEKAQRTKWRGTNAHGEKKL